MNLIAVRFFSSTATILERLHDREIGDYTNWPFLAGVTLARCSMEDVNSKPAPSDEEASRRVRCRRVVEDMKIDRLRHAVQSLRVDERLPAE